MMFGGKCKLCGEIITEERQTHPNANIICVAQMKDNRIFSYGMVGDCEFQEHDLPLTAGDQVCLPCMQSHKYGVYKSIQCHICGEKYQGWDDSQAWGCCGHVEIDKKDGHVYIACGFGSHHDMVKFHFGDFAPLHSGVKQGSLVCDDCIDKFVADKTVTVDNSFWEGMLDGCGIPPEMYGE